MTKERWMAVCFAAGSTCFLVGPFPGYANLVGDSADAVTFFIGSVLFTAGGALQALIAFPQRHSGTVGRGSWWAAAVQLAGTLFFNITTYRALHTALSSSEYDKLVWRPDALGSVCFLVSGAIAYRVSARRGWRPVREGRGWWEPSVNLLGCILFGIAAVAGYAVPATGSLIAQAPANVTTALGAACFLACAGFTVITGRTSKSVRFRRLRKLERLAEQDADKLVNDLRPSE
jgi:hypothetical protein